MIWQHCKFQSVNASRLDWDESLSSRVRTQKFHQLALITTFKSTNLLMMGCASVCLLKVIRSFEEVVHERLTTAFDSF